MGSTYAVSKSAICWAVGESRRRPGVKNETLLKDEICVSYIVIFLQVYLGA